MDPLSITTALLSFLTISGSCAGSLRRLVSDFKTAPTEILAVSNELSDLNVIVHDVETTRRDLGTSAHYSSGFDSALASQLSAARIKIDLLASIIDEIFVPSPSGNHRFERQTWVRRKPNVLAIKQDLVDIKRRLSLLLTSNNASRSARIELCIEKLTSELPQILRQVPTSSARVEITSDQANAPNDDDHEASIDNATFSNHESSLGSRDNDPSSPASSYETSSFLDMVRQIGKFAAITFHVHRLAKCEGDCACHCHSRKLYRSPRLLNDVFGALFVGYAGLPVSTTDCNISTCSNQYSRVMQLSYTFPAWFLAKTVDIVAALTYTNEPSFGLKVRNRILWMGENSIFQLARQGDKAGIIELFKQRKASPNDLAAGSGYSPLHYALELGHIETCEFLLDIGVDPHIQDDSGGSDAHEISSLILSKGGARQPLKARQYEAIFPRIANAHSELWDFTYVQRVVVGEITTELGRVLEQADHRAEIDRTDLHGRTALFWAALRGDITSIKVLLGAGANHRIADRECRIALHAALISGNLRCVEILLMAGSDIHARDKYGDTALQIATWAKDDPEMLEALFLAGASLDCKNRNGVSSLQHAACLNHARNGAYLLTKVTDVDSRDKDNDTPLSETIRFGNLAMMNLLLNNNARCDLLNNSGETLLHVAALYGNLATIRALSAHQLGAIDLEAKDSKGRTAHEAFDGRMLKEEGLEEAFRQLCLTCAIEPSHTLENEDAFEDALEFFEDC